MIVIPREEGEGVVIGEDVVVTVVEIRGDTVRLSIEYSEDAPSGHGTTRARRRTYREIQASIASNA